MTNDVSLQAIIVDCEHGDGNAQTTPMKLGLMKDTTGNINDSDMHDQVSAISGSGASPIVRVRGSSMPIIKRALDTGAQSVYHPPRS